MLFLEGTSALWLICSSLWLLVENASGESVKIPRKQTHLLVTLCTASSNSCAVSVLPYPVPNHCFSGWMTLTAYLILSMVFHSHSRRADWGGQPHRNVYKSLYKAFLSFLLELFWFSCTLCGSPRCEMRDTACWRVCSFPGRWWTCTPSAEVYQHLQMWMAEIAKASAIVSIHIKSQRRRVRLYFSCGEDFAFGFHLGIKARLLCEMLAQDFGWLSSSQLLGTQGLLPLSKVFQEERCTVLLF